MASLCSSKSTLSSRGYSWVCPSRHQPSILHPVVNASHRGPIKSPANILLSSKPNHSRGNAQQCKAGTNNGNGDQAPVKQDPLEESDLLYIIRISIISLSGAALVKYGSLIINAPFHPDAGVALALVFGPPLIYSLVLYLDKQRLSKL